MNLREPFHQLPWAYRFWVAAVALISLNPLLDSFGLVRLACLGCLGFSLLKKQWAIIPAALMLTLLFFGTHFYPAGLGALPALPFLLPVALTFLICWSWRPLRLELRWCKRGDLGFISLAWVAVISLLVSIALLAWAVWTNNLGAGAGMVSELEGIPRLFLFLVGVPLFALTNAVVEEVVYRGFLLESLNAIFPRNDTLAVALQASAFAAAHYYSGFPNGLAGYILTFIYGFALGKIRLRSNGIAAPILAHLVADLVVGFTLILLSA